MCFKVNNNYFAFQSAWLVFLNSFLNPGLFTIRISIPAHDYLYNMLYKILFICLMLSSCTSARMMATELYFGQTKPDGSVVAESDWNRFRDLEIMKVFKEGCTILPSTGYWRDPVNNQLISEPTYIVVYLHKKSPGLSKQIDSLRVWYKSQFQQQSVLRVDKKVKASF